tara:strand:+ start:5886 stop:6668 length:783 start_codon:yes stop_codon:yes gene_type:complete
MSGTEQQLEVIRKARGIPAGDQGVTEESPTSPPAASNSDQEQIDEPRQVDEPVPQDDGEPRIPKSRFDSLAAKLNDKDQELAELRSELEKVNREKALSNIYEGKDRPDGWGDFSDEQRMAWTADQVAQLHADSTRPPLESEVSAKWKLMEEGGYSIQQAGALHSVQKEFPGMSADDARTLAHSRSPELFATEGASQQSAEVPDSHVVAKPRSTKSQAAPQSGDSLDKVVSAMADARSGKSRGGQIKAGLDYINHQLGIEG